MQLQKAMGFKSPSSIKQVCGKENRIAGEFHWQYENELTTEKYTNIRRKISNAYQKQLANTH
jgi:hypothetical protein